MRVYAIPNQTRGTRRLAWWAAPCSSATASITAPASINSQTLAIAGRGAEHLDADAESHDKGSWHFLKHDLPASGPFNGWWAGKPERSIRGAERMLIVPTCRSPQYTRQPSSRASGPRSSGKGIESSKRVDQPHAQPLQQPRQIDRIDVLTLVSSRSRTGLVPSSGPF